MTKKFSELDKEFQYMKKQSSTVTFANKQEAVSKYKTLISRLPSEADIKFNDCNVHISDKRGKKVSKDEAKDLVSKAFDNNAEEFGIQASRDNSDYTVKLWLSVWSLAPSGSGELYIISKIDVGI